MEAVLPVLLLGLSLEGLVLCPAFTFGVSLSRRAAGLHFLAGRLLGITALGALLGAAGERLRLDPRCVNLAFGGVVLAMGVARLARLARARAAPAAAIEPVGPVEPAAPAAVGRCGGPRRGGCGRPPDRDEKLGFSLGLFRGLLNPGRKHLTLAPLVLGQGVARGAALSLAFGLASSVYLALGLFSAGLLGRLVPRRRLIDAVSGAVLAAVGLLSAWRARDLFL